MAERVAAHYAAALQAVRGVWQAQHDLAARDWDRALGAAAALELADVLGVALTDTADAASHRNGADSAPSPRGVHS